MFKLTDEQLKWKELIKENHFTLIFADRGMGKSTAMRLNSDDTVIFVKDYHKMIQYKCEKGNIKTRLFNPASVCGFYCDTFIFDDVLINKDNYDDFECFILTHAAKIVVIGTYHY